MILALLVAACWKRKYAVRETVKNTRARTQPVSQPPAPADKGALQLNSMFPNASEERTKRHSGDRRGVARGGVETINALSRAHLRTKPGDKACHRRGK